MLGYDTVKLWMPYDGYTCSGSPYWDDAKRLGCKTGYDGRGRQVAMLDIGNMRAVFMIGGLSVRGSLARYAKGDNLNGLLPEQVPEVLASLSERLQADLTQAKATRIDAAMTARAAHPIPDYLDMLGAMPRKSRNTYADGSICYRTKGRSKELAFYDKGAEMQAKGGTPPPGHWLRYEMRAFNPKAVFGCRVSGADLGKGWPLERLAAMMWKEYQTITKTEAMKPPKGIRTAGQGKRYCRGVIMQTAMQSGVIGQLVDSVRRNNPEMTSKELYRMRKELEAEAAGYGEPSGLARELDGIICEGLGA